MVGLSKPVHVGSFGYNLQSSASTTHSGISGVAVQLTITLHYGAFGVDLQSISLHWGFEGFLSQSAPSGIWTMQDVPL